MSCELVPAGRVRRKRVKSPFPVRDRRIYSVEHQNAGLIDSPGGLMNPTHLRGNGIRSQFLNSKLSELKPGPRAVIIP